MGRIRTFVAVETTDEVRRKVQEIARRLGPAAQDVKWTAAGNLHWTLHFLGDVEVLEIPAVCEAVAEAANQCASFELAARGAGAFPSSERPRTLWVGAGQGSEALIALQQEIDRRLRKLGYRSENRRFVPHLTLGRAGRHGRPRSMADELASLSEFDAGRMVVDEVVVFESQLTREGSVYEPLCRAPLAP